jgi:hypothetical protein
MIVSYFPAFGYIWISRMTEAAWARQNITDMLALDIRR